MTEQSAAPNLSADLDHEMRGWRHALHRKPELGFDVHQTAGVVAELLGGFGLTEVHTGVGQTGVVGVLSRGTSDRAIGLRADMDALPITESGHNEYRSEVEGVFHGCGHDGHTAMLLGAAHHLASTSDRDDGGLDGTVYFVFQPDEENGRGAQAMIDDGLFDRFAMSAIYGMHNKPGRPLGEIASRVGPMMSSEDLFEITIGGRGGHASMPELHIDPVVIAAEIISALQTIVSRSVAANDTAVVSVTELHTDGARNIVPSNVTIKGDCRTFSRRVQETIEARMRALVTGICDAHGADGNVAYTHEFIPLVNTLAEHGVAMAAARAVAGADNVNPECTPVTASEDFARMLQVVPGCYVDIGNGTEGACANTLHNPHYDFNDDALVLGARYWVRLVQDQLASS